MFSLKDKVIFIADSHYSSKKTILVELLEKILYKKIEVTQLILMGDIFDFLSNEIEYFIKKNKIVIDLINKISENIEVIYLEGNHDFNLQNLFLNTLVIPRKLQPISIIYNNKKIKLAHGDIYTPFLYNFYTYIIRNRFVLKFLNLLDINNWLTKQIEKRLEQKDICKINRYFNTIIKQRLIKYNCDLIIEGHFHQNSLNTQYINIPSLFCDKEYLYLNNKKFSIKLI